MAMTPYSGDTSVIGKLGTTPQERGLTTQQFKDKFDEGLKAFVEWFNLTHKTEFEAVQTDLATHKAEFEAVQTDLATHKAEFEAVQTDLATHKADYTKDKADYIYMHRDSLKNADLNTIGDFGCYRLIGGNSNIPSGFNNYGLMIINYAPNGYVTQEIIEVSSGGKKWIRSTSATRTTVKAGGATWYPWRKIATEDIFTATLESADWTGTTAPFTQVKTISGILATDTPIVDVVMSGTYATDEARQEAWSNIYRITTANDSITLYAKEKPTVSLPIQLKVVR